MATPDISEVHAEVLKIKEKLDKSKQRDWLDYVSAVSSVVGSVVLAGVGLWFTMQTRSIDDDRKVREDSLKKTETIISLVPHLTSSNGSTKRLAYQGLYALTDASTMLSYARLDGSKEAMEAAIRVGGDASREIANPTGANQKQSAVTQLENAKDTVAKIVRKDPSTVKLLSDRVLRGAPEDQDVARSALLSVQKDALPQIRNLPPATKAEAAKALVKIADDPQTSAEDKERALSIAQKIVRMTADAAVEDAKSQPIQKREIDEVILTSSPPSISQYKSEATIRELLRQSQERGWPTVGWHYLITPDGSVWRGRPMDVVGAHTQGRNAKSVGVSLMLDANKELPTAAQKATAGKLLAALLDRFHLFPDANFAPGRGFHRDYRPSNPYPGKKLTKDEVIGWLKK